MLRSPLGATCSLRRSISVVRAYSTSHSFQNAVQSESKSGRSSEIQLQAEIDLLTKHRKIQRDDKWELTVGIEIHAQLNCSRKLFSPATTLSYGDPNTQTALFDLSTPGSQPIFQKAVLVPAIRAAVALRCNVNRRSSFDRKHYFYQDQPAGYQITQYYSPFATNGFIKLTLADGLDPADGQSIKVGIKQIQLEQDTAKSVQQPPDDVLLDFNRVGHPLIEIITLPHIHSPQSAAACVRKIHSLLEGVNAVTTGMESGGLRADVNVSVQRRGEQGSQGYAGVEGLGQRVEIKNLSTFKAVEDAITAERDRQIEVLESGGTVIGETRGWSLGSKETRRLRGKEGEVDYRYMPDPDIPPLLINNDIIRHIRDTFPPSPIQRIVSLVDTFDITLKDARTLVALDRGLRLDYLSAVLESLEQAGHDRREVGRTASNWCSTAGNVNSTNMNRILHELGGLLSHEDLPFEDNPVPAASLSAILDNLLRKTINGQAAKKLLSLVFTDKDQDIASLIAEHDLYTADFEADAYSIMAERLLEENPDKAAEISLGKTGKLKWFVGQMMRESQGKMDAQEAEKTLKKLLDM